MGNKFKNTSKIMLILGLTLIVSGVLLYFITNSNNKSNNEEKKEVKVASKTVGNEEYGYISIPEDWNELPETENGLSYQGTINNYVVTISKYEDKTAKLVKEEYIESQLEVNAINIQIDYLDSGEIQIDSYPDSANRWSSIMIYEIEEGKIISVSIDGPVKNEEYLNILKTYKTTK